MGGRGGGPNASAASDAVAAIPPTVVATRRMSVLLNMFAQLDCGRCRTKFRYLFSNISVASINVGPRTLDD